MVTSLQVYNSRAEFEAATVTDNRWAILHQGEVLEYKLDNTAGTAITSANGLKGSPAGTTTVKHFGALGDGSQTLLSNLYSTIAQAQVQYAHATSLSQSLDWAAIQAAAYWERDNSAYTPPTHTILGQEASSNYKLEFNPRSTYYINDSLDFTGLEYAFSTYTIQAWGATLLLDGTGMTGLDFLGSRHVSVYGGKILASLSNVPRVGIQIGRTADLTPADHMRFVGTEIKGSYSLGCLYNYASEESHFDCCTFRNEGPTTGGEHNGYSYCVVQDGDSYFGAQSQYQNVAAANTAASFLQNEFVHCDMRQSNTGGAIFDCFSKGHIYEQCYGVSYDWATLTFFSNTSDEVARDLRWIGHEETDLGDTDPNTGMKWIILYDSASSTALYNNGLQFSDPTMQCDLSVYAHSNAVSSVTMTRSKVNMGGLTRITSQTMFDTPADYTIEGIWDIGVPTNSSLSMENVASFTGTIACTDVTSPLNRPTTGDYVLRDTTKSFNSYSVNIVEDGSSTSRLRFYNTSSNVTGYIQHSSASEAYGISCAGSTPEYYFVPTGLYPSNDRATLNGLPSRYWHKMYSSQVYADNAHINEFMIYEAGSGSNVTQATSKTSNVSVSTYTGKIVTATTSMAAGETAIFTVDTAIASSNSIVQVSVESPRKRYSVACVGAALGGFDIALTNIDTVAHADAVQINYECITGSDR